VSYRGSVRLQVSRASKEKDLPTPRHDEVMEGLAGNIATTYKSIRAEHLETARFQQREVQTCSVRRLSLHGEQATNATRLMCSEEKRSHGSHCSWRFGVMLEVVTRLLSHSSFFHRLIHLPT
jgi:hypothetical protein